jgi:CRP/FNR family transcriptional regulator, cyclic AMP receptor protein
MTMLRELYGFRYVCLQAPQGASRQRLRGGGRLSVRGPLVNFHPMELFGWAAAACSLFAFYSKTMIPLRIAVIAANAFAIVYSTYTWNIPNLIGSCILLPLNIVRLREMQRLTSDVKRAHTRGELDFDWLQPFMKPLEVRAGDSIFAKGDEADSAYVIAEGQISLPDLGVILGPGSLFGEMGLFSSTGKRMSGARALSDVRIYRITYQDFEQLYFQNPQFGLYLIRLMVRRMEGNLARLAGQRRVSSGPQSGPVP